MIYNRITPQVLTESDTNIINISLMKSVNGIPFGSDRSKVRDSLGKDFKEFKKTSASADKTDDYGAFHIFYKNNKMQAIEVFPEASLSVNGKKINWNINNIKSWVAELDKDAKEDPDGIIIANKGVGITISDNNVKSILFAQKAYYTENVILFNEFTIFDECTFI